MKAAILILLAGSALAGPLDDLAKLPAENPSCIGRPYSRFESVYDSYQRDKGLLERIALQQGTATSPYDGTAFDPLTSAQREHIVARREAHYSGLCQQPKQTKRSFVTDLSNLTLATPLLNQQKGSHDAALWYPERNTCWFAATVIHVKTLYGLAVDPEERAMLEHLLDGCTSYQPEE